MKNKIKIKANLKNKLRTIHNMKIIKFENGKTKTIKDFYNKFIEPRLPKDIDCIIKWHKLLLEYIDDDNVIFTLRSFGSYPNKEKNKEDLRRGFINSTNLGFKTVFVDNFFTSYFFSMAYDGYVPKYKEFKEMMISRKFPIGYIQTDIERNFAGFPIGKSPKIQSEGYKIAHVCNAGENFNFSEENLKSIGKFCNSYF